MPLEFYIPKNFRTRSRKIIEHANAIITEHAEMDIAITLRQLYYQFVARTLIPNTPRSYKNLGAIINDARLAGQIDWYAIEDGTRWLSRNAHAEDPEEVIDGIAEGYMLDRWIDQETRVEVWIEKGALLSVIRPVCEELDVPYFACRGNVSQSEQWKAGKRFLARIADKERPQDTVVLHLGDHDPSGIDMTRDNLERLAMFSGGNATVKRIALNMNQVEEFDLPPNPAKVTDSRYAAYQAEFGDESWELDAFPARKLQELIRSHVLKYRDEKKYNARVEQEEKDREMLQRFSESWADVKDILALGPASEVIAEIKELRTLEGDVTDVLVKLAEWVRATTRK